MDQPSKIIGLAWFDVHYTIQIALNLVRECHPCILSPESQAAQGSPSRRSRSSCAPRAAGLHRESRPVSPSRPTGHGAATRPGLRRAAAIRDRPRTMPACSRRRQRGARPRASAVGEALPPPSRWRDDIPRAGPATVTRPTRHLRVPPPPRPGTPGARSARPSSLRLSRDRPSSSATHASGSERDSRVCPPARRRTRTTVHRPRATSLRVPTEPTG